MTTETLTMPPFHARAWMAWVVAAAILAMVVRNPLYTLLLLLIARLLAITYATSTHGFQLPFWRIGAIIIIFSTLLNALSAHTGSTVLLSLPAHWPLIGGAITLEAMVYGAINGLSLLALLAVFATLNAIVPSNELVQMTPRALHDLGLVVLISLTYLPETTRHLQRVREAQAIRGHRLRGVRDWYPIVMPLLIGGLERAMQLAEAMVARGYGATAGAGQKLLVRLGLVVGLAVALAGWIIVLWYGWPGWLLLAGGTILLVATVWQSGRQTAYTPYRPSPWRKEDVLLLLAGAAPLLVVLLPLPIFDRTTLYYSPYPRLQLPGFDPLIGLALACLALPALWSFKMSPEA